MVNSEETGKITYAQITATEKFADVGQISSLYGNTRWKPGREARCCAFSKDGLKFAWSVGYGQVKVESHLQAFKEVSDFVESNSTGRIIDCSSNVVSMEFAPSLPILANSSALLATGLEGGQIKIWNTDTGEMVFNLSDHESRINGLTFSPCGLPILVSCSLDKTLKVWDLGDDGNMSLTITGHKLPISDCAFSPTNPHMLASVGMGKSVIVWKLIHKRSFELALRLRGHNNDVVACSWSPDGALLATASHDTTAIVWDPFTGSQIALLAHQYPMPCPIYVGGANGSWVTSVCFSSDGTKLATVCEDNCLRVWKMWGDNEVTIVQTDLSKLGHQCRFSPDGSILAVGKQDGSLTVAHDKESGVKPLRHLSRLAARQCLNTQNIEALTMPKSIKDYLLYRSSLN
uniref:WD repeat and SOCS box-containing protein 1 n=1 Tax=Phallusia mammillata TaxID=59560 RepID=A0A6F9DXK2_9ASCI|nr:WD repeat and SOCS box-containing protein 1 [Phallusia mammillata]